MTMIWHKHYLDRERYLKNRIILKIDVRKINLEHVEKKAPKTFKVQKSKPIEDIAGFHLGRIRFERLITFLYTPINN